jgi:tetratricopeptide (TPR) repeat protein
MIARLEQVVRQDPGNARAHLKLAAAYLRRFDLSQQTAENAMSLADIRDAATEARAAARNQQEQQQAEQWLSQTIARQGDYLHSALRHTREGLALCPLQGQGYLYLAELRFLEGPGAEQAQPAYVDQALRVRPFDGAVLFEAGRAAMDQVRKMLPLGGDLALDAEKAAKLNEELQRGTEYWQRSFQSGREHQLRLVKALTGRVPVQYFIETYQPDRRGLRLMHASYCGLAEPEQSDRLCRLHAELCRAEGQEPQGPDAARAWVDDQLFRLRAHFVQVVCAEAQDQQGEEAAESWLEAAWLSRLSGNHDQALHCAERAWRCTPNSLQVRRALGVQLAKQGRLAEAEEHLNWCLRRDPNDQDLQNRLRAVVKRKDARRQPVYRARSAQLLR